MTTTPEPVLEVTPPPELTVPVGCPPEVADVVEPVELAELELVELVVVLVVLATADEVPGTVAALTAPNTPRAAKEAMATPEVSWLISR